MFKSTDHRWRGKLFALMITWLLVFGNNSAVADATESSAVTAALALNFARFTEWPAQALGANDTTVKLCVIGDNVIQQAFDKIDQKQVGTRTLQVVHLTRIKNLEQCHLLYISGGDRGTTIQLLSEIQKQHTLTIGEDRHFLQDGGMVLLNFVEGKVNIEIQLSVVKQAGLQINSRVLKLATIVNP